MASPSFFVPPSSASSSSLDPVPFPLLTITREEFVTFHRIDRKMFARLVLHMDRDAGEPARVMALFMWLENAGQSRKLIAFLNGCPDDFVCAVANEAVLVLRAMESEEFAWFFNNNADDDDEREMISILRRMTKDGLTLRFFYENRSTIFAAVTRNLNGVCARAFQDIYVVAARNQELIMAACNRWQRNHHGSVVNYDHPPPMILARVSGPMVTPVFPMYYLGNYSGFSSGPGAMTSGGGSGNSSCGHSGSASRVSGHEPRGTGLQREVVEEEEEEEVLREELSRLNIGDSSGGGGGGDAMAEGQTPPDDRTIFLTFSKGYPISESEVTEYFTRRFGDCIEAVFMQEVAVEEQQPLYARLVLHKASMLRPMLGTRNKAKFTINGKHVWARKYIRKSHKSPTRGSSSPKCFQPVGASSEPSA